MRHTKDDSAGAAVPPELLASLELMEPPPGFARMVLEQAEATAPVTSRRSGLRHWVVSSLAVGLAVASAMALVFLSRANEAHGELLAVSRTTLHAGKRGVLVLEPGADVSYAVGADGDARVIQRVGRVFYRVERAGPFVVETPLARVEVIGTCFLVEVPPMMSRSELRRAALVAAGTAAVVVTVYEGQVRVVNGKGALALAAGERARVDEGAGPERLADAPEELGMHESEGTARIQNATARVPMLEPQAGELVQLRARVRELEEAQAKLDEAQKKREEQWSGTPSKEELLRRAKSCTLRWDLPNIYDGPELPNHVAGWYGVNDDERLIVTEARRQLHRSFSEQLRRLYVEVTGDQRSSEILSLPAMEAEIRSKAPSGETQRVFQRLSAEKAGLAAVPRDLSGTTPLERLMRILTSAGDDFERSLAKELGRERARAIRGGKWENNSGSTPGCPPG